MTTAMRPLLNLIPCLLCAVAAAAPHVPFPHPVIMEVLFTVPTGEAGDANQDGVRDAAGDEFVELMNPHDRPINLEGYVITDRNDEGPGQVRFEFPAFTIAPGQVVVVFNGRGANIAGPVGDARIGPLAGNENFDGAMVFTMRNTARNRAFSNAADVVILWSPRGEAIDVVVWGSPDPPPPEDALRTAAVRASPRGSVQRLTPGGELIPHERIDGRLFSPGRIPSQTEDAAAPRPRQSGQRE